MKVLLTSFFALLTFSSASIQISKSGPVYSTNVIDGVISIRGEAPYIVSLQNIGGHYCAGSIIYENWVLTSAHCLTYPNIKVVAGLFNRFDLTGTQIRSISNFSHIIPHPKAFILNNKTSVDNSKKVLLLKPINSLVLSNPVNSILLPDANFNFSGDGTVYGWGTMRSGNMSDTLQKLDTGVLEYPQCKKELPVSAPLAPINICSFGKGSNKYEGACNGDSGGPLVQKGLGGTVLIGLVSWGYIPCETTPYPSVYTSTKQYRNWIDTK
uniref:Peptidase S1 domain-containing protein n=1 Tax=Megaselia scalaris TaxID=36166 RepID=T1GA21_MEGSC